MKKYIPSREELLERYSRLHSVRKVAQEFNLGHSTVWRKIGPVLPVKAQLRRSLAFKPVGVSVREWASMHNVSPATYYYWMRKVAAGQGTDSHSQAEEPE